MIIYFTFLYGAGVFLILWMRNGYFDLMEAKADFFKMMMCCLLPIEVISIILKTVQRKIRLSLMSCSLIYLLLTSLISTVCSYSPLEAFSGRQGWHVGFFTIASLIVTVLSLKDEHPLKKRFYFPLLIVCMFEFLLSISDCMGFDLLSIKEQMEPTALFSYFATLGNSNWCVGFYSLSVPLLICLMLSSKRKEWTVVLFLISLSGIVASVLNGADGIYLSYAIAGLFVLPYSIASLDRVRRLSVLVLATGICFHIIWYSSFFFKFFKYYDSIGKIFFQGGLSLAMIIAGTVFCLVSRFVDNGKYQKRIRKIAPVIPLFIVAGIVVSVLFAFDYRGSSIDSYRFELWRLSIKQFEKFPLFNKLFGFGPELLRNIYARMYDKYGIIYNSSHSEPIQVLLTMGVSGLLAWLMCYTSLFILFIKTRKKHDGLLYGLYTGVFSYFGQCLVNSATIPNLCILSLYAIAILQFIRSEKEANIG